MRLRPTLWTLAVGMAAVLQAGPPSLYAILTLQGEAPGVRHLIGEGLDGFGAPVRVEVEGVEVPFRVVNAFHIICLGPEAFAPEGDLTVAAGGKVCAYPMDLPALRARDPLAVQVPVRLHPLAARFNHCVRMAFAAVEPPAPRPKATRQAHTSAKMFGRHVQFWDLNARLFQVLRSKAGQPVAFQELLEAGWDRLPPEPEERRLLLAQGMDRLRNLLHGPDHPDCLHEVPGFGFRLDADSLRGGRVGVGTGMQVLSFGQPVYLNPSEARLFKALSAGPGHGLTRVELSAANWPGEVATAERERRLRDRIARLRIVLRPPAGVNPIPYDTRTGTYRLDPACLQVPAPLERLADAAVEVVPPPLLVLDPDHRRAIVLGVPTKPLGNMEWRLVAWLANQGERCVPAQELDEAVWGPGLRPDRDRLSRLVARVRRKLEPLPARPRYLVWEAGKGYRLLLGGVAEP